MRSEPDSVAPRTFVSVGEKLTTCGYHTTRRTNAAMHPEDLFGLLEL